MRPLNKAGFTLVELLVATTMISVVMVMVYSSFNSSLKMWRSGDRSVAAYQDARIALTLMTRELQSMLPTAMHLFEGESDSFQFYEVATPLYPGSGDGPRTLWVRYSLRPLPGGKGKSLMRQEAPVEGALPLRNPNEKTGETKEDKGRTRLGKKREFELASGVSGLKIHYLWMPAMDEGEVLGMLVGERKFEFVEPIEEKDNVKGRGRPQGVRVELTMLDERAADGKTTFTSTVVFRGPTAPVPPGLEAGPGRDRR